MAETEHDYAYDDRFAAMAELVWGPGLLSGAAATYRRLFDGVATRGCRILDIGCGLGGADIMLIRECGCAACHWA